MKIRYNILLILTFFVVISSCQKPPINENIEEPEIKGMRDLIISESFDWKTTKDIQVVINLPVDKESLLPISIADPHTGKYYFTGFPEDNSSTLKTTINVPSYLSNFKLVFPEGSEKAPIQISTIGNNLLVDLNLGQKSVMVPCDLTGFITYTEDKWSAPATGNNVGNLRNNYFNNVFSSNMVVGDPTHYTITFTSAAAIENFLPTTGINQQLSQNLTNPSSSANLGDWAGQIISAILNVSYNEAGYLGSGYTDLKNLSYISGPFAGMTINDFLVLANTAIGGGTVGFTKNQISYAAKQINMAFDGTGNNFFTCSGSGSVPNQVVVEHSGTLAYEDLWPWQGDYDFNDLVISYTFEITKNINEQVQHIKASFKILGFGASFNNGFGFSLPGIPNESIVSVTGTVLKSGTVVNLLSNGLEAGQSSATVIVIDDVFDIMPHPGLGIGVNTELFAPYVQPQTIVIDMDFGTSAITFNQLNIGSFNPFIFVDQQRGTEIHLPGYSPTSLADPSLIGTGEDTGNQGINRYYKTVNNLPWAINIPIEFEYPIEKQDITSVFTHFAEWAESNGDLFPDWYMDLAGYRNNELIYTHN